MRDVVRVFPGRLPRLVELVDNAEELSSMLEEVVLLSSDEVDGRDVTVTVEIRETVTVRVVVEEETERGTVTVVAGGVGQVTHAR